MLGKRLGKRMKEFQKEINSLDSSNALALLDGGTVTVLGEEFDGEEIAVQRQAKKGSNALSDRYVSIDLDCELTPALIAEGYAREVVNRVQQARKDQGFDVSDRIELRLTGDETLLDAVRAHVDYVQKEVLAVQIAYEGDAPIAGMVDGKEICLLYTSPSPRDATLSRMPSSA